MRAGFIDHVTILIRDYARARLSVRIIAHRASHRSDHSAARPATEGSGYRYKTAKTRSRYEMKIWEEVMKNKLVAFLRRFVLPERNGGANGERHNKGNSQPQFKWPYVMNSSGYYRVRR
ncbi:MAG: hypothetical protein DMF21_02475 [Verrucomicrobia bacterium]|nr:MAG: hypothetical protein DMF21_02475 [Verrucomicrobiota bacterium]